MSLPFSSLRSRLLLLVLVALIPAFGLFVFSASDNRQHESIAVQQNALYLARLTAGEQQQLILSTRQLLTALAHLREVQGQDHSVCSRLLGELLPQYPLYSNLGVADARGDVYCSGVPFTPPVNLADRPWFQRAVSARDFVVGEYQIGRITGKPSILFGYPLLDSKGAVLAVVYAGVDLDRLNQTALQNRLPSNAVMNLIDRNGTLLMRYPDPGDRVGKTMPESDVVQAVLAQGEGTGEMRGVDGVERLYAFSPVGGTDREKTFFVAIGTPLGDAFGDADWILRRNLIGMGLVSVLVLAGAWVLGNWFIMHRVQALVRATQQLESGDLHARTGLVYGVSELSQLARAFDRMAGSLEQRELERKRMDEALQNKAAALQTLVTVNREMLTTTETSAILELVAGRAAELLRAPKALIALASGDAPARVATFGIDGIDPTAAEEGRKWGAAFWRSRHPSPLLAFGVVMDPADRAAGPEFLTREQINSLALAPLHVGENWLGMLIVLDKAPRRWSDDEIQLLDLMANQTALALDKTRLYEETEHRAEQLALLYDAGLALNSVREPRAQLEFLFKITKKTIHADRVEFFRFDSAQGELAFELGVGYAAGIPEALNGLRFRLQDARGLVGRVAREHAPLNLNDLHADPDYIVIDPALRAGMWVPVEHERRLLGVLGVLSEQPNTFAASDERLLVLFANQAAIALENARLFEELQRSLAMTTRFYELSNQILSATTLPETARVVLRMLREGFTANSASLHLFSSPGRDEFCLGDGFSPAYYRSFVPHSDGFTRQALSSGKPFLLDDPAHIAPNARAQGVQTTIILPLRVDGRDLGAVFLDYLQPRSLAEREIELFSLFANQVALALERVRLVDEAQRRIVELEAVNRISSALRAAQTLDEIVTPLLDEILALLQATCGCIYLYDPAKQALEPRAARVWPASTLAHPRAGLVGQVFTTGCSYVSREFKSDENRTEETGPYVNEGWGGAHIPIPAGQTIVGVLAVAVPLPREITPEETHLLTTVAEIAGSAIHRAQLHGQTEQRLRRLTALREVDLAISASLDLRIVLNVLLAHTASQLDAEAVGVLLYDAPTQTLEFGVGRGFRSPPSRRIRLSEGAAGRAFLERQTVRCEEWRLTGDEVLDAAPTSSDMRRLYYAAPLIAKAQVVGIFEVFYQAPLDPDDEWLEFLNTLAGQAAIAIENAQLFSSLQRSNAELALAYDTTLEGWSRALDLRDRETEGHALRVAEMTLCLAEALGMDHSELGHLRRGALLHDIGKMGLPDAVLLKPSSLTDQEWQVMRQHPVYAYELLSPIAYLRPALEIPHDHHEKWDGTGYPRGLKEEQIPLAARLFAVVDVYDALQCDRPYRPAWSERESMTYIQAQAGKHFDPQVVEAFVKMLNEGR